VTRWRRYSVGSHLIYDLKTSWHVQWQIHSPFRNDDWLISATFKHFVCICNEYSLISKNSDNTVPPSVFHFILPNAVTVQNATKRTEVRTRKLEQHLTGISREGHHKTMGKSERDRKSGAAFVNPILSVIDKRKHGTHSDRITWRSRVTWRRSGETAEPFPHVWRRRCGRSLFSIHCSRSRLSLFTSHDELDLSYRRVDGIEHVATLRQRQFYTVLPHIYIYIT